MSIVELSIHRDYVPDWEVWCGIREIVQNSLDEHDKGHPMTVEHNENVLSVSNEGAELRIEHLLIGCTDKRENKEARGEKGEGLDLGMLALVREGYNVEVLTPTERWTPYIDHSETWNSPVLFVEIEKLYKRRDSTQINVKGIDEDIWLQLRSRFIDLCEVEEENIIRGCYHGELLLGREHRGMIFAKGIYVQTDSELTYGYNLTQAKLDRDRRMVADFELKWEIAKILDFALSRHPDRVREKIWHMLENDRKDVQGFSEYTVTKQNVANLAAMFSSAHGENAVPVQSMGESEEMNSLGSRGIVTTGKIRELFNGIIKTPEEIKKELSKAEKMEYSWEALDDQETANLKKACARIDNMFKAFRGNMSLCDALEVNFLYKVDEMRVMNLIHVVDFRDESLRGTCNLETGEIKVARKILRNYYITLRVIVHELAHSLSVGRDTSIVHSLAIEEIWVGLDYTSDTVLGETNGAVFH